MFLHKVFMDWKVTPPWSEDTPVAPGLVYAQAKYATELMLESLSEIFPSVKSSSIRLSSLAGGAPGLIEVDFLSKIARRAFEGKPIRVIGGMQQMERMDIRDSVNAIMAMLSSNPEDWIPVYNLGSGKVHSLLEIAQKAVDTASRYNGGIRSAITVKKEEIEMNFGMDSARFREEMKWEPEYSIDDTIESLMKYFGKRRIKN